MQASTSPAASSGSARRLKQRQHRNKGSFKRDHRKLLKRLETLARERDGYEAEEVEEELNGGGAGMDGAAAGASATPMAASTTNTQDEAEAEAEASHPSPVTASSVRKNPNGLGENVKGSISSGPSAGSVAGDTQNRRTS